MQIISFSARWVKEIEAPYKLYIHSEEGNSSLQFLIDVTCYDSGQDWQPINQKQNGHTTKVFKNKQNDRLIGFHICQQGQVTYLASSIIQLGDDITLDDGIDKVLMGLETIRNDHILKLANKA
ncbi:hypothetical protein MSP8887_01885 [Marinomonas spartinae]|uniref:hypothetical protein n=1 Tax=Marinomonas spartinae TaxID=1792290 RepID=UPI000808BF15|nr:hypothetical protein [Marinomonas spartinae]SBS33207.1 hypothetical protein MSP8887_01885 [Marinomonas spartinae]